jgi:hypothetical protein
MAQPVAIGRNHAPAGAAKAGIEANKDQVSPCINMPVATIM